MLTAVASCLLNNMYRLLEILLLLLIIENMIYIIIIVVPVDFLLILILVKFNGLNNIMVLLMFLYSFILIIMLPKGQNISVLVIVNLSSEPFILSFSVMCILFRLRMYLLLLDRLLIHLIMTFFRKGVVSG